nr:actin-depolymerizing factor 5-like [Ipomoea batatas]
MWVTDECKNSFMEMKWKKVHRYIVFKFEEESGMLRLKVEKVGGAGESYEDLAASLPKDDCRYAVFDFDFGASGIKSPGKNGLCNLQRWTEESTGRDSL